MTRATCPYCEKPVLLDAGGPDKTNEVRQEARGTVKKEIRYSCLYCDKFWDAAPTSGACSRGGRRKGDEADS